MAKRFTLQNILSVLVFVAVFIMFTMIIDSGRGFLLALLAGGLVYAELGKNI